MDDLEQEAAEDEGADDEASADSDGEHDSAAALGSKRKRSDSKVRHCGSWCCMQLADCGLEVGAHTSR
jgi:hypothetical protein